MGRRRPRAAIRTIPRKIHFYEARFSIEQQAGAMVEISDPRSIFAHVRALNFTGVVLGAPASRYLETFGGNLLAILSAQEIAPGIRGTIGTIRRNALPDVERSGRLRALSLPPNAGLFEATHFVLFLPQRILGMEFNLYGPRTGRLGEYLLTKCNGLVSNVEFVPILRRDVRERLREIGEISEVQIAIHKDGSDVTRQLHDSLPSALNALKRVSGDQDFEIIEVALRKKPYSRHGHRLPFDAQRVLDFLSDSRSRDELTEFRIRGRNVRTDSIETFDLLEDRMVTEVRVIPSGERRRSIDSESMFRAIEHAFRAQREELLSLIGRSN